MAGSFVLLGLSGSILSLAVAIAVWGIAASVYHPAGLALLSTRVERTGMAFGYHGIGGNIGIALGPLTTVVLLLWFDWRTVSMALALPALIVLVVGLFVDTKTGAAKATAAADGGDSQKGNDTKGRLSLSTVAEDTRTLATVAFALVIIVVMMNGLYYRAFLTFLPDLLGDLLGSLADVQLIDPDSPYAEEFDLARYFYVGILIAGVAGQYLGGHLAERLTVERALVYVFGSLVILAMAFVPASSNPAAFITVSLLLGVAVFTIQPLEQAAVAKYAPPGTEGLSFGYTFLAIFGIGAGGAALAGFVLTYASVVDLFAVLGGIAAVAAVTSLVLLKRGAAR
jgi:MFS family permease